MTTAISLFLLLFMTLSVVLSATVLFLHFSLSTILLLFSFILSCIIVWKYCCFKRQNFIIAILIGLAIIVCCTLFSSLTIDNTWDGAAYHKNAVGFLKEGWNPYFETPQDFLDNKSALQNADQSPLQWVEVYPKGTWYFAALVYQLTDSIEAGKCYTILFAIIFGLQLFSHCYKNKISLPASFAIAWIGGANPIVLAQFQTYYLDGVVGCVIMGIILCFLEWLDDPKDCPHNSRSVIQVVCYIVWACNLKFSVILFVVTACAIYILCLWIHRKAFPIADTCLLAVSGIGSCVVVGWSPYIVNIIRHQNPFYGFFGLFTEATFDKEFGISGLGNVGRFFVSLFARTSHGNYHTLRETLKIPFTFKTEELEYYAIPDARLGGFGIFFSGLFLCSLIYLIFKLVSEKRRNVIRIQTAFIFTLAFINFIELANLSGTHTARYIPHFFGVILYLLADIAKKRSPLSKHLQINKLSFMILVFFSVGNTLPWYKVSLDRTTAGIQAQQELTALGRESEKGTIYNSTFYSNAFNGIQYNLIDHNISYQYCVQDATTLTDYSILSGFNWIYYKAQD